MPHKVIHTWKDVDIVERAGVGQLRPTTGQISWASGLTSMVLRLTNVINEFTKLE